MVLVQEDEGIEHPIYYLSKNLNDTESKYSYVEKLALAAVQAIQRFRHYVLFRKTTILSDCNPMSYIFSRQLMGRKYSKWIAILQEFDLEFVKSKSNKAFVFAELLWDLPSSSNDNTSEDKIVDESLISDIFKQSVVRRYNNLSPKPTNIGLDTSRSKQKCIQIPIQRLHDRR